MGLVVQIAQLILCLSILVVLHEWGHYITARWFKMRVEKFYLFFNPYFSLFKKKIGDTEWGLGWLPLGGYVKISGMIDESMDKDQMKSEPKPYEFRSKPAWQRLIVMLGGIIVNAILAVLIFSGIFLYYGEEFLLSKDMKYGILADSLAQTAGLQSGDKIIAIDDKDSVSFPKDVVISMLFADSMTVDRNGEELRLAIPKVLKKGMIKNKQNPPISMRLPAIVGGISESDTLFAKDSELKVGDEIVSIDGKPLAFFDEISEHLENKNNQTLEVTYIREGKTAVTPVKVSKDGKLGIAPLVVDRALAEKYTAFQKKKYGLFAALQRGFTETKNTLVLNVKQFQLIFDSELEAYKEVGSFISITKAFPTVWHWESFWRFTAFLSIWLAFLNLLPIPGLDGGHAVFAIYEVITGRKPSDRFMEIVQTIGMVFLLAMMALVLGWDIFKNTPFYKG